MMWVFPFMIHPMPDPNRLILLDHSHNVLQVARTLLAQPYQILGPAVRRFRAHALSVHVKGAHDIAREVVGCSHPLGESIVSSGGATPLGAAGKRSGEAEPPGRRIARA